MPVYSEYLYSGGLSPSPYSSYSTLLLSGRSTGTSGSVGYSGTSGYSSSGNYYSGARTRYSPLLPTISESGLSPKIGRRSPRAAVSYTASNLYSPRTTAPSYHVPRPISVNTENIDVSTPRQTPRRPQTHDSSDNISSVPRSTIKRGRTVVRIHTKHTKEDTNEEKNRRLKMTPGERLKEKHLLRESEWDRKKREEEESIKLKEIEREEAEKRFKRLMLLEENKPLPLPDILPVTLVTECPKPELIPVEPEVKTVFTDDLDTTPKNSSSDEDDTDTESSSDNKIIRKKKRKKDSRRSSADSIPEDDILPTPTPRNRRKSDQLETEFAESKRDTIKRKLSSEKLNSIKGGVSKRKSNKKTMKIEGKIIPVVTSVSVDSLAEPKSPKLYIENIVVEEEQIIMIKTPPRCRNKKKQIVVETKQNNKITTKQDKKMTKEINKETIFPISTNLQTETQVLSESKPMENLIETTSILNTSVPCTVEKKSLEQKNFIENETQNINTAENIGRVENTVKVTEENFKSEHAINTKQPDSTVKTTNEIVESQSSITAVDENSKFFGDLPPKKWDRRESKMDWEWPEETLEPKSPGKKKINKKLHILKDKSQETNKLDNTLDTVKHIDEGVKCDIKNKSSCETGLKTKLEKIEIENREIKSPVKIRVDKTIVSPFVETDNITATDSVSLSGVSNTNKSELSSAVQTSAAAATSSAESKHSTEDLTNTTQYMANTSVPTQVNTNRNTEKKIDEENTSVPTQVNTNRNTEKKIDKEKIDYLPIKKWDRRDSRMDWEWPDEDEEEEETGCKRSGTVKKQGTVKRNAKTIINEESIKQTIAPVKLKISRESPVNVKLNKELLSPIQIKSPLEIGNKTKPTTTTETKYSICDEKTKELPIKTKFPNDEDNIPDVKEEMLTTLCKIYQEKTKNTVETRKEFSSQQIDKQRVSEKSLKQKEQTLQIPSIVRIPSVVQIPSVGSQTSDSTSIQEPIKWNRRESRMDWVWPEEEEEDNEPPKIKKLPPKKTNIQIISPKVQEPKGKIKAKKIPSPLILTDTPLELSPKDSPIFKIDSTKIDCDILKSPKNKIQEQTDELVASVNTTEEMKISDKDERSQEKDNWLYSATHEKDDDFSSLLPVKREKSVEERISKITSWLHPEKVEKNDGITEEKSIIKDNEKTTTKIQEDKINKLEKQKEEKENKPSVNDRIRKMNADIKKQQSDENITKSKEKRNYSPMTLTAVLKDNKSKVTTIQCHSENKVKQSDIEEGNVNSKPCATWLFDSPESKQSKSQTMIDKSKHDNKNTRIDTDVTKVDTSECRSTEKTKNTDLEDKLSRINAFLEPVKPTESLVNEKSSPSVNLDEKLSKINACLALKAEEKDKKVTEVVKDKKIKELDDKMAKINAFLAPQPEEKITKISKDKKTKELDDKMAKINAFLAPQPEEKVNEISKDKKTKELDDKMAKINAFLAPKAEEHVTEIAKDKKAKELDEKMAKINAFLAPKPEENVTEVTTDKKTKELGDKMAKINAFLAPKAEEHVTEIAKDKKTKELDEKMAKINAFLAPKAEEHVTKIAKDNKTIELNEKMAKINAFLTPKSTEKVDTEKSIPTSNLEEKLGKINAFLAPTSTIDEKSSTEKIIDTKNTELDEKLSKINAFLTPKPNKDESKSIEKTKSTELDEKLSKINAFLAPKSTEKSDNKTILKSQEKKEDAKPSALDEKLRKINAIKASRNTDNIENLSKSKEDVTEKTLYTKQSELDEKLSKINAFLSPKKEDTCDNKTTEKIEELKNTELDDKLSKINAWLSPMKTDENSECTEKNSASKNSELDDKLSKINAWLVPNITQENKCTEKITEKKSELDEKLSKINAWLQPKTKEQKSKQMNETNNTKTADPKKIQKPLETSKLKTFDKSIDDRLKTNKNTKSELKTVEDNVKSDKKPSEVIESINTSTTKKTESTSENVTTDVNDNQVNVQQDEKLSQIEREDELRSTLKARGTIKENKNIKKSKQNQNIPDNDNKSDNTTEIKQSSAQIKDKVLKKKSNVKKETDEFTTNVIETKKKSPKEIDKKMETVVPTKPTDTLESSTINNNNISKSTDDKIVVTVKKSTKMLEKKSKKKSVVKKTEEQKPKIKFPAPTKPLFMNPILVKKLLQNRQEPVIKPLRRFKEPVKPPEPIVKPPEPVIQPPEPPVEHQVKITADRVSTIRHLALKQPSTEEKEKDESTSSSEDDEDSDTETETSSSGSDTETEENQSKPDRTSTSSEDSGIGSTHTSPLTNKNECSVNCHRKCEKHMPNLCGVNQKLLAEALCSVKKGRTNPGSTKNAAAANTEGREGTSPGSHPARRLSTSLSSDSESGEEGGGSRRYTPPARTIPRFRKYTVEDYQFLKVLGKGSFGKVLLAELRGTDCYYAVKCLKKDVVLEDDDVECTLIERKVLALGTRHPYLCHLFCTFQTESHLFFVMEYLNGGDLMFHIQQSGRFEQARACFYAAEIVSGLKFLHKKGIVYRDLKLDNILLDYEGHVRIADFGMCKLQIYLDRTADTFCGTPDYMAPEIIKGLHYNQCVDWWSFGVLLYEMLIGQSPFNGCDEDELFWSICNEQPYYPRFLSKESQSILALLLDKDSSRRLGTPDCPAGDVYVQPFFKSIDWPALDRKELEPPFKPRVLHALDVQYFDTAFTQEAARLTPVDKEILQSMDQSQFHGFSYTNPNACNE